MDGDKLWSHQVAQNPLGSDPGEVEALRARFSNSIVILLPLSDGRWAIMGADRQLAEILPEIPSAEELTEWSLKFERSLRAKPSILRAEGAFYGEPSDRDLIRDAKARARTDQKAADAKPSSDPTVPLEW
jgi:hypothetical protein